MSYQNAREQLESRLITLRLATAGLGLNISESVPDPQEVENVKALVEECIDLYALIDAPEVVS